MPNIIHNGLIFNISNLGNSGQFSSVQSLSRVQLFATPWIATRQASLTLTSSRSWLKLMSIESVMPSSHLILCRTLLLLPPIPPSTRVFPINQFFMWSGQSIGLSASASVFPKNTQDWSPVEWTGVPQWSWKIMWGKILKREGRGATFIESWHQGMWVWSKCIIYSKRHHKKGKQKSDTNGKKWQE